MGHPKTIILMKKIRRLFISVLFSSRDVMGNDRYDALFQTGKVFPEIFIVEDSLKSARFCDKIFFGT